MLSFRHYIECAQYNGGEIGIRTLDTLLTYAGFQDRCIQPLCHLSALCDSLKSYQLCINEKTALPSLRIV